MERRRPLRLGVLGDQRTLSARDLGRLYGVSEQKLRRVLRVHAKWLPRDFFAAATIRTPIRSRRGGRTPGPLAFTGAGVVMLAFLIDTPQARRARIGLCRSLVRGVQAEAAAAAVLTHCRVLARGEMGRVDRLLVHIDP